MLLFSTLLFSLFITMALIPLFKRNAARLNCLDIPNERKVHCDPMPKVGGLAMAIGALVPLLLLDFGDRLGMSLFIGCIIIVLFGFLDDSRGLSWKGKLGAQLAAALVVVLAGNIKLNFIGTLLPWTFLSGWVASVLTVIIIIGVTNAVNLADGLDGLAGGIMLVSFSCIGFLAFRSENTLITLMAIAATGAILGFLPYNTHPATVFMGDTGSQLLGFLAGTMSLVVTQSDHTISPVLPLFLIGLPIIDTLLVMFERIFRGRFPFHGDTNHIHHKLLRMNFFHSEAVMVLFVLQCGFVMTGFWLRFQSDWLLFGIYLAESLVLVSLFSLADRKALQLNRPGSFDRLVKQKLRVFVKDSHLGIRVSQKLVEFGLPFLIIITCLLPGQMPRFISIFAVFLIAAIGLTHVVWPAHQKNVLRLAVYFFMPFVIYYSETRMVSWIYVEWQIAYNLLFFVLLFFAIATLRSTRRRSHFRITPFDYALLFTAIVVPNLPFIGMHDFQFGAVAAKIIVLYFVSEVLFGEMESRKSGFNLWTVAALLIVVVRAAL